MPRSKLAEAEKITPGYHFQSIISYIPGGLAVKLWSSERTSSTMDKLVSMGRPPFSKPRSATAGCNRTKTPGACFFFFFFLGKKKKKKKKNEQARGVWVLRVGGSFQSASPHEQARGVWLEVVVSIFNLLHQTLESSWGSGWKWGAL